ncbi:hypothetical protein GCM10018790_81010 [Kitasatospora xanthocidica]|uniref:hypothetical protein n=1 Tax=Kitasatospora xanthocidica TaxID=83382 RepID=UPI00167BD0A4|nr:hypothetical protein [Kitasatospora xanthocidica]GHF91705.1 hypothetical protein GCM10018790_81010 [Kitasatospora xanthocidica]
MSLAEGEPEALGVDDPQPVELRQQLSGDRKDDGGRFSGECASGVGAAPGAGGTGPQVDRGTAGAREGGSTTYLVPERQAAVEVPAAPLRPGDLVAVKASGPPGAGTPLVSTGDDGALRKWL